MLRVPAMLSALLLSGLSLGQAASAATDFWVYLNDGSFVVGQFESDEFGDLGVTRAWVVRDSVAFVVNGCSNRGPTPLSNGAGEDSNEPVEFCDMFEVIEVDDERVFMLGREPQSIAAPGSDDGDDNGGSPDDPDVGGRGGSTGGARTGGNFPTFFALLVPDGNGEDMGSMFAITYEEIAEELEYLQTSNIGGDPLTDYDCEGPPTGGGKDGGPAGGGEDGATRYVIPLGDCLVVIIVHGPSAIEMIVYCKKLNGCWGIETFPDSWSPPDTDAVDMFPFPNGGDVFLPLPGEPIPVDPE